MEEREYLFQKFDRRTSRAQNMVKKERDQRFGKLISQPDDTVDGRYLPWAATQKPGSVKQVVFHADSRR